ncbi:hypothetical protein FA95DRAFT_890424 [Auriscalpium vulgare]|uniref:Uncharacterized protein n=1 Tax=Auriscalpium vulgare TaxID=40419 RepID=A0ACB8RZK2_9AGAM|nr:hypothetical protein FA95DRAFT_890424 [Auriscalpium vulgare]
MNSSSSRLDDWLLSPPRKWLMPRPPRSVPTPLSAPFLSRIADGGLSNVRNLADYAPALEGNDATAGLVSDAWFRREAICTHGGRWLNSDWIWATTSGGVPAGILRGNGGQTRDISRWTCLHKGRPGRVHGGGSRGRDLSGGKSKDDGGGRGMHYNDR